MAFNKTQTIKTNFTWHWTCVFLYTEEKSLDIYISILFHVVDSKHTPYDRVYDNITVGTSAD